MAEIEQAQAEQGQEQEAKQDYDAIKAEVLAGVKDEIAGLNRKISELTREKEEKEAAAKKEAESKLSLTERLERMEQMVKESEAKAEAEKHRSTQTKKAISMLEEAGLPAKIIEKVDISSDEAIVKDIEFYSHMLSGYEQNAKDEMRKKHAFKPTGGEAKASAPKSLRECKTKEEKIAYLASKHKE